MAKTLENIKLWWDFGKRIENMYEILAKDKQHVDDAYRFIQENNLRNFIHLSEIYLKSLQFQQFLDFLIKHQILVCGSVGSLYPVEIILLYQKFRIFSGTFLRSPIKEDLFL